MDDATLCYSSATASSFIHMYDNMNDLLLLVLTSNLYLSGYGCNAENTFRSHYLDQQDVDSSTSGNQCEYNYNCFHIFLEVVHVIY